jgi:hypothetical protein
MKVDLFEGKPGLYTDSKHYLFSVSSIKNANNCSK